METVDQSREFALLDQIAAYRAIPLEADALRDTDEVVGRGLEAALDTTRSAIAFAGLVGDKGTMQLVSRRAVNADGILPEAMHQLARAVVMNGHTQGGDVAARTSDTRLTGSSPAFIGVQMLLGSEVVGMVGVAGGHYTPLHKEGLAFLADRLAAALEIARLRRNRQELVDTLVNVQAELELSERRLLVNEERARSAERLERAHDLAIDSLRSIASNLRPGETLDNFYRLLTADIANLVGAKRVLFWRLTSERTLTAIPGAHGIDDDFIARLYPAPCDPDGTDLTSQVVYQDLIFRAALGDKDQNANDRRVLDSLQVTDAISVPWRAGDERLGVVAAYDSTRRGGFTREDAWVMQITGMAAGLVWQLKQAEADLGKTVERLERVDSARQLLLQNLSTAVERARRRFASELHDDALQKLTAAELVLARATQKRKGVRDAGLAKTQELLQEVEEALRKLLFDVRPPALEAEGGLEGTIRDRMTFLRANTGINVELEFEVPEEPPYEIRSLIYRQVAEALTNIEKHAAPHRVRMTVRSENDGIYAAITDDGRGFIVSERNRLPGHLGLLALNERALLAGGWCKISSEPGAGTIVEFWVPIPR